MKLEAPGSIGIEDQKRIEIAQKLRIRMEHDGFVTTAPLISDRFTTHILHTPSIVSITSSSIQEHIEKARYKITQKDFSGAITNAYSLVEDFLKAILKQVNVPFKEGEGDIRSLIASVSDALSLNPKRRKPGKPLANNSAGAKKHHCRAV